MHVFSAIVRRVSIDLVNPADDCGMYVIEFANDLAASLALQDASSATTVPLQDLPVRLSTTEVGSYYVANIDRRADHAGDIDNGAGRCGDGTWKWLWD